MWKILMILVVMVQGSPQTRTFDLPGKYETLTECVLALPDEDDIRKSYEYLEMLVKQRNPSVKNTDINFDVRCTKVEG